MASAAGVIQFNKPEAARDSKPGGRGPLPPNPAFPAQSEGHGKPRLQTVALRAEGSGFLRGPPHPRRLAAPPPGRLPTPAAGSQSQSRHPLPPRPETRSPCSGEGTSRGVRSSLLPGSRAGASRPQAPLGKGNLTPPSGHGDRRWSGGWRGGNGERRKRSEAWSRRASTRERRGSLGIPGTKRPWGQGADPPRPSAGPARRAQVVPEG